MKKLLSALTILSLVFLFAACGNGGDADESGENTRTVVNSAGEEITIPADAKKIIAGAPSVVEIMVGLGVADKLVAIDNYSTDVEGLPEGIPTFDSLSPDIENLLSLEPEILITSGMSLVSGAENPYQALVDQGVTVIFTDNATSLEGISDILFIADVCNVKEAGETLISNLSAQIDAYRQIGNTITDKKKSTLKSIRTLPFIPSAATTSP